METYRLFFVKSIAIQIGHIVPCYTTQEIKLGL
jgi:hypothetical protein